MDNDDIYIPDPNTYISINLQIKTRSHKINNHAGHFVPLPPQLVQNVQCPWIERGCGGHNRHSLARFDGLAKALDVAGLALMLLLKGNCWAAGYIEDIVHRRLKYIYICFFNTFTAAKTSTQASYCDNPSMLCSGTALLFWVSGLLLLCCRSCSFLQHEGQGDRATVYIEDIHINGHARNQCSMNCVARSLYIYIYILYIYI